MTHVKGPFIKDVINQGGGGFELYTFVDKGEGFLIVYVYNFNSDLPDFFPKSRTICACFFDNFLVFPQISPQH